MSNTDTLCGTAAGYNVLGPDHTMTCEDCKAASRKWAEGWFNARRNGPTAAHEWAAQNPPKSIHA